MQNEWLKIINFIINVALCWNLKNEIYGDIAMTTKTDTHKYDDIINLPHHQSKTRPHMSLYDRAAQFSPFSALTGYDDILKDAAKQNEDEQNGL